MAWHTICCKAETACCLLLNHVMLQLCHAAKCPLTLARATAAMPTCLNAIELAATFTYTTDVTVNGVTTFAGTVPFVANANCRVSPSKAGCRGCAKCTLQLHMLSAFSHFVYAACPVCLFNQHTTWLCLCDSPAFHLPPQGWSLGPGPLA